MFLEPINGKTSEEQDQSDCPYAAGDIIPASGVYEVCHKNEKRTMILLFCDRVFPVCMNCGDEVRYKLFQAAPHISEDPDFQR